MKSRQERKIKESAGPFLEEGEEVLAAIVARPRGWTQAMAGSAALGETQEGRAYAAAGQAGFRLASPMALAVTQKRLLSLGISTPIGLGIGGEVKARLAPGSWSRSERSAQRAWRRHSSSWTMAKSMARS